MRGREGVRRSLLVAPKTATLVSRVPGVTPLATHIKQYVFPQRSIYWVTETKISVCEGNEGCTVRKSGPGSRLVREPPGPVRVPADRSPRYTNFSQLNMGSKAQKNIGASRRITV